ncbi:MAG: MFS transporter [Desulfovibrio sp.]|jgi:MFS family permease|nr:MFS transporter [Desulfovibrio sp.]
MADDGHRRHIICFALITALCLTGDSMLYIVLPLYYREAGLNSLWEVGIILAANRIVRLPLNPPVGRLYTLISERTGILVAVFLATATTLTYGFASSFPVWLAARCLWGAAWTLLRLGSLFCILRVSTPDNRGRCTGLYNGLYRLGSLVGMLCGGFIADAVGLRGTALIFAAVTAPAIVCALLLIPAGGQRRRSPDAGPGAGLRACLRTAGTLRIAAAGGIVSLVIPGILAPTLSLLIAAHTGGGVEFAGILIGAASLGGFFQALRWAWEPWLAPLTGKLADRRGGRDKLLYPAFAAGGLLTAALAAPLPLPFWFACLLGIQLAATALTTLTDIAASDAAARAGGHSLLVIYAFAADAGMAVGPILAYGMNEILDINDVYIFSAGLLFLYFLGYRKGTPPPAERRRTR